MTDPKNQNSESQGNHRQRDVIQVDRDSPQIQTTPAGDGLGANGQSGEQRNDAGNDPNRHNAGVTGH